MGEGVTCVTPSLIGQDVLAKRDWSRMQKTGQYPINIRHYAWIFISTIIMGCEVLQEWWNNGKITHQLQSWNAPAIWSERILRKQPLTLMVLIVEYSWRTGPITMLLMPWLLASPGHQLSWHYCKTAVSPLLTHWRYCCLALIHLYIWDKQELVFHEEGIQQPAPSLYREIIENANILLHFLK